MVTAFLKPTPNSSYQIITCATLNSGDVKFPIGCKKCRSNKKNACLSVHILLFMLLMLSSAPLWIECMGMEVAKGRQCSTTRRSLICSLLHNKHLSEDKKKLKKMLSMQQLSRLLLLWYVIFSNRPHTSWAKLTVTYCKVRTYKLEKGTDIGLPHTALGKH